MFIKVIASFGIILSSTAIGIIYSNRKKMRLEQIRSLITALTMLQTEIRFAFNTLPKSLDKVASNLKGEVAKVFQNTSTYIKEGNSTKDAFKLAMEYSKKELNINVPERIALEDIFATLGKSDIEGELKSIMLGIEVLQNQEKDAFEDTKKYCNMYKSLGVSIGIALVVIVL